MLEKACPDKYTKINADTCIRIYSQAVQWMEAFSLCNLYTGDIGSLFQYNPDSNDTKQTASLNYLNMTIQTPSNYWIGWCVGE